MDSSAWIAIYDRSDEHHREAVDIKDRLLLFRTTFVLTNHVFDEVVTFLKTRVGHRFALSFGQMVKTSKFVKMIHCSEEIEDKAWAFLERYEDKDFSLTDCVSFILMNTLGIKEFFAFDEHFNQTEFDFQPVKM